MELEVTATATGTPDTLDPACIHLDHQYNYKCKCSEECSCVGCTEKNQVILKLTEDIESLTLKENQETNSMSLKVRGSISDKFIKTDRKVRLNTGLKNLDALMYLYRSIAGKARKMSFWPGTSRVRSTKVRQRFFRTPERSGSKRKFTIQDELVMVLMKLRLGFSNDFLASIFGICAGTYSKIFFSWVKLLAILSKILSSGQINLP